MQHAVVVGAGVGGLAAAIALASQGVQVQVLERDPVAGGKLAPVTIAGQQLDAGPTVFTLRSVFDMLFELAGARLDDHLALTPLTTLARHAWPGGTPPWGHQPGTDQLDLFADLAQASDAMGRFAGAAAARQYHQFCRRARSSFEVLDSPYLRSQRPNPISLAWRCGLQGLPALMRISPFQTLWGLLGAQFDDPRLRQLFARYATYGGSSPMAAPATLMLIAHVERCGVWSVAGGMYSLAQALTDLARALGVRFEFGAQVRQILVEDGRARGVVWQRCGAGAYAGGASGEGDPDPTGNPPSRQVELETLRADVVVFNGDVAALAHGLLGPAAQRAVPAQPLQRRSLSALTWNLLTPAEGFPLLRHTVFFSRDYAREFDELCRQRRLPDEPTVYLCAQDRGAEDTCGTHRLGTTRLGAGPPERLLCLVNAPAGEPGDARCPSLSDEEIAACETRTLRHLAQFGLQLDPHSAGRLRHTPQHWATRFPATGGALYGQATHGWRASFNRPPARSALPGLYLAGGSTHPGAGVPMAALSGLLAAQQVLADQAGRTSIWTCLPVLMPGGISTP
jgi:1-hydroxycarotenoid 3,4-desaturase